MRTVKLTLDDDLVVQIDRATKELDITRSEFARQALRLALKNLETRRLEEQHRRGYTSEPAQPSEFDDWSDEQAWVD